jgi:hypothetical protein
MAAAFEAFRRQLREVFGDEQAPVQGGPHEMDVPGFVTLEATVGGHPVRGWARDDGAVVLFARQNFGLVLDAVDFAAEPPGMDARDVVRRLVWMLGPRYELVERVAAGELGMDADVAVPVRRERTPDGGARLVFAVRERDAASGEPVVILHYQIAGAPARPFQVGLRQLAPPPDPEDE